MVTAKIGRFEEVERKIIKRLLHAFKVQGKRIICATACFRRTVFMFPVAAERSAKITYLMR